MGRTILVDTSKTLWVGIGCYDGCRWDAMGRTLCLTHLELRHGCWDAMGRTKTFWLTHLKHCGWR